MATAVCTGCEREQAVDLGRGARLADRRCRWCQSPLQGKTAGRPSPAKGRRPFHCPLCHRRRLYGVLSAVPFIGAQGRNVGSVYPAGTQRCGWCRFIPVGPEGGGEVEEPGRGPDVQPGDPAFTPWETLWGGRPVLVRHRHRPRGRVFVADLDQFELVKWDGDQPIPAVVVRSLTPFGIAAAARDLAPAAITTEELVGVLGWFEAHERRTA